MGICDRVRIGASDVLGSVLLVADKGRLFIWFFTPFFVGYVLWERWPQICDILCGGKEGRTEHGSRKGFFYICGNRIAYGLGGGGLLCFVLGALLRAANGPQQPASLAMALGFGAFLLSMVYVNSNQDRDEQILGSATAVAIDGTLCLSSLYLTHLCSIAFVHSRRVKFIFVKSGYSDCIFRL